MPAVFIAQKTLTEWSDAGKVRVDDTTLVLIHEKRSVDLIPAVRFTALEFGDEDPNKLLGKVKTVAQLKEMGAEHMMESVIFGDMAYTVVEGFMGDLMGGKKTAPAKDPPKRSATPAPVTLPEPNKESDEPEDDAAALSKLFLDTVQ